MIRHLTACLLGLTLAINLTARNTCEISNLIVEAYPCVDGLFYVDVDFDVFEPEGEIFGIVGNAMNYGFFEYDSLPVTLGPLEGDGVTVWEFIVYDLGNPTCQATFVLGIIDCCSITDVTVDNITCTGLETFQAVVDFNYSNTGNIGFDVFDANGSPLGFFPYTALPVTVGNIPSEGIGTTFITICDNDNEDCCTDVTIEDPDCNPNDCEIYNVEVVQGDCQTGQFFVTLSFSYENVGDNFIVTGNGMNYGTFQYGNLPITLGPFAGNGMTIYEFVVTDASDPTCNDFAVIGPVECPPTCGFLEIEVNPLTCQSDSTYLLHLDFTPIEVGELGFSVYAEGMLVGMYPYEGLPVIVEGFPVSGEFYDVIVICDNVDSTCCDTIEFPGLQCQECLIYNVIAEPSVCNEDGQFFVTLDFDYWNVSDSGFQIGGNGNNYGTFNYEDVPVTLGPFDGDSTTFYEFVVIDLGGGFCLGGTELGIVNCDCGFDSISVDPLECSGNGTYHLLLDFVPVEVTNAGFDVYAGNEFVGYYLYENLPVVVENFPESNGAVDVITICDNDNPTCCTSFEFVGLDCSCDVFELTAQALDCDPETNTFGLVVNFAWEGNVENFTVYIGDDEIGVVNGANLPDTLYGLTSEGGGELITVCANEIQECCAAVEIIAPQCGEQPCSITELVAEAFPCDPETNTFALYIDFDWTGDTEFFDVFMGGEAIAFIAGANLPDTIYGLTSDGGGALITVCANDMMDCCSSMEIVVPECPESCHITELVAEAFPCDTATNTFALYIDFNWTGDAEVFNVFLSGEQVAEVLGVNLPDTITGLTSEGGGELVMVCADNYPDCCASVEIVAPQCGEEPCSITELVAEAFPCDTATNMFALYLDFDWTGDAEVFNVFMGGVQVAEVLGVNLPDTITGLTSEGGGELVMVCADNYPDCCASVEIVAPQCGEEPCDITEFVVEVLPCDTATNTFAIVVDFAWTGNEEVFNLYIGGDLVATIEGANLPVTIDGLTSGGGGAVITVCGQNHPDCCAIEEAVLPDCGPVECRIFEVDADAGLCTSDSTFTLSITFLYEGFMNDFVDIWTGDTYLGFFPVAPQPIVIQDFPWNGNAFMPLRICENDNPECCKTIEFAAPNCSGACVIYDVNVDVNECTSDSTFSAWVSYLSQGLTGDLEVWANGEYLGVYPDISPILVSNIPEDDGIVVLQICEQENAECCVTVEFEGIICTGSCAIYDLVVTPSECDSNGLFTVTLDFEYENVGSGFTVAGNGTQYGVFTYNQLPLTLGPLPGNGITLWEFVVLDLQNPGCLDFYDLGAIDCEGTGLFDRPGYLHKLDIIYTEAGPQVVVPEGATGLRVWTYDGKQVGGTTDLMPGDLLPLNTMIGYPGLYLIQVNTVSGIYVGKVLAMD